MERIECVGFSVTCTLRGKQAAVESSQFDWIGFQVVRAKSSMLVIVREHRWDFYESAESSISAEQNDSVDTVTSFKVLLGWS